MSDVLTHRHAGPITSQHSTKPGLKAWGVSLVALSLVAGGVIARPRLLSPPAGPATAANFAPPKKSPGGPASSEPRSSWRSSTPIGALPA